MTFLYRDARPHADPNGNSVVVRVDLGSRRILLAGDAEASDDRETLDVAPKPNSIERWLLTNRPTDLRADVLIVGHHGSETSSRLEFLDAIHASYFVISSGPFPYKSVVLPDDSVVEVLENKGTLFQTNKDDLACKTDPAKIGPDNDNRPGGCKNVLIAINGAAINADYFEPAD